jgi:hypothetical protein
MFLHMPIHLCQNPGKIFLLRTWQTVMDNKLSAYASVILVHIYNSLINMQKDM